MSQAQKKAHLRKENKKWPNHLVMVPREEWPEDIRNAPIQRVLRSNRFLVQVFDAYPNAIARLSVCRTEIKGSRWSDGISWDELQEIKNSCGYADCDAVEIYPCDEDVVNVANMRHLWIMRDPIPFAWRKSIQTVVGAGRR